MTETDFPELVCPLTHDLYSHPVSMLDGEVYERWAIEGYLQNEKVRSEKEGIAFEPVSPMTNEKLMDTMLVPNRTIRKAVTDYLEYVSGDSDEINDRFRRDMELLKHMRGERLQTEKKELAAIRRNYKLKRKAYEKLKRDLSMQEREANQLTNEVQTLLDKSDQLISNALAAEDCQRALTKARKAFTDHEFDVAIEYTNDAIRANPFSTEAHFIKGAIQASKGDTAGAIKLLELALSYDPNNYEALCELGLIHRKMTNYNEAVLYFQAALKVKKDSMFYNNLGATLVLQNKPKEAFQAFHDAIAADKNNVSAHKNVGLLHHRFGEYSQAVIAFKNGLIIDPKNASLKEHLNKSLASMKKGNA